MRPMTCSLAIVLIAGLTMGPALAGNRAMIEKRTEELHGLNEEIVGHLSEVLKNEKPLTIRARVYPREGIIQIDGEGGGKVHTAEAVRVDEVMSFKTAISRYRYKRVEIVPLTGAAELGDYTPFYKGIIRIATANKNPR